MPTIAGQAITSGSIRIPEQGDWFGDISTNTSERIPDGTRVDIVVENVTLSGAIVRGGITGDVGRYQVAGRPEWDKPIIARRTAAYYRATTVKTREVLTDICRETLGANWQSIVELPPIENLGNHFQRPGTFGTVEVLARDLLELLELPWYVRADGVTVFATRPSGTVSTEQQILVSKRNDAIGYRVVNCEDLAAFAPGLTFEGETIGDVTYAIRPDDVEIHVWTRTASNAFANLVRAVWRRMFPHVELQGLFSYTTIGPSIGGRHDLRSTRSRHLPDVRTCDTWTIAGHTAELQPGTRVVVTFVDGDPTQPLIVGIDPSTLPQSMALDVAPLGEIELADALGPVVRYGDTVAIVGGGPAAGIISFTPGAPPFTLASRVKA